MVRWPSADIQVKFYGDRHRGTIEKNEYKKENQIGKVALGPGVKWHIQMHRHLRSLGPGVKWHIQMHCHLRSLGPGVKWHMEMHCHLRSHAPGVKWHIQMHCHLRSLGPGVEWHIQMHCHLRSCSALIMIPIMHQPVNSTTVPPTWTNID